MNANQEMLKFWQTSMRMAFEMPWVMGRRLWMFSQPWDDKTTREYQLMFLEKTDGFSEAWQYLLQSSVVNPWLLAQPANLQQYERLLQQSLHSMNQTLKPLSRRVHANHRRLGT